jgi:hypothetical protein
VPVTHHLTVDADHVLAFDGCTSRGEFAHTGWTVAGLGADQLVNLLVSGHELEHAALNSSPCGVLAPSIAALVSGNEEVAIEVADEAPLECCLVEGRLRHGDESSAPARDLLQGSVVLAAIISLDPRYAPSPG